MKCFGERVLYVVKTGGHPNASGGVMNLKGSARQRRRQLESRIPTSFLPLKGEVMTSYLRHWIAATLVIIALGQSTFADDDLRAPRFLPAIQVPAGNTPFLVGQAVGTQNYVCL